jgi:hypothetical protein
MISLGVADDRISDLELEEGMPRKVFLRETIDKEVRLSYLERIQRTLPEEYFAVFPEKADVEEWKTISGMYFWDETNER